MEQRSEEIFQMKEENKNVSFNFYQEVLVLVITAMRMQLYKC